jgi:hypothetical protein
MEHLFVWSPDKQIAPEVPEPGAAVMEHGLLASLATPRYAAMEFQAQFEISE